MITQASRIVKNGKRPLYREIADKLRVELLNGGIAPGDRILPEKELALSYNVGLVTMQRALKVLSDERLIVRNPRGTFLSEHAVEALEYKNIGIMMPALGAELTLTQSPTHFQIFEGIQKFCHENSWDMQIVQSKLRKFSWHRMSQWSIAGMIVVAPRSSTYKLLTDLRAHDIPFLAINLLSEQKRKNVNFVNIDFRNSAVKAVRHLQELGRRRIAVACRYEIHADIHSKHVVNGYKQAVRDLNLPEMVLTPERGVEAEEFVNEHMLELKKCDGIIAAEPETALAIFNALKKDGVSIPKDVSLVSFYDNEGTRDVGITSYNTDLTLLGYKSAAMLKEVLNDENGEIRQMELELDLYRMSSS